MQNQTLRTFGASVVLAGVVIAGITQLASRQDVDPAEIVAEPTSTPLDTSAPVERQPATNLPEPFVYRAGVLAGISTDNFWAFYGSEPSAWNSYVLGPTKPALYTASGPLGALKPELATTQVHPTFDAEGWRVRVDLNPDLQWSDGTPVTAHDVVFTFETVRSLGLSGSWADAFGETIESIHADDDHHLRIEFRERPRLSVWPHGVGSAPIMARHIWAPHVNGSAEALYGKSGEIDVSGGPLEISTIEDSLIVSRANVGYPLNSLPDTVEYHVYGDEKGLVDALARGEIDTVLSPNGLSAANASVLKQAPGVEVVDNPGNGIRYLGFNLERDPMSDHAFRAALALLLDRETLADSIPVMGDPAWSLIPTANRTWYDADAARKNVSLYTGSLRSRLDRALQGLATAGYAWKTAPSIGGGGQVVAGTELTIDGRPPQPLTILTPGDAYDPARPAYVEKIAETLRLLGFDARPVETDFDTVVDLAFTRGEDDDFHYDMYLLGWTLGNPALPGYYDALFSADGPMNNTGYDSEAFAASLRAYESAVTEQDAFTALWEMEQTLATDLPYLPLYTSNITEAYRSDRVTFVSTGSLGGIQARLGGIREVRPTASS